MKRTLTLISSAFTQIEQAAVIAMLTVFAAMIFPDFEAKPGSIGYDS